MAMHLGFLVVLTGLTGIHSITTVSEVSVKAGRSISIPCLYGSEYINHVKYLCKGYYWNHCSIVVRTDQPRSSGKYSISDDKNRRIFTVTIKDLTAGDTGFWWCAVEINRASDERAYFHLSVTVGTPSLYVDHQEITAFIGGNITISCHNGNTGAMSWCRLGGSCVKSSSGSIDGTRVTIDRSVPNVFTVAMSGLRTESGGWYWCVKGDLQMPVYVIVKQPTTSQTTTTVQGENDKSTGVGVDLQVFIISLSLLIFTVMLTLFIWFILKRRKQTKVEPSATTREEEVSYSTVKTKKRTTTRQAEEEVTYSDVKQARKTSSKKSDAEMRSDADVMYSSVVAVKQQTLQRGEAKGEDVTYSTLAQP